MSRLTSFIAGRYLFARGKKNVVNVISWISLIGIAVGTTALIVVLSVYNGIGNLTQSLFNVFDAELLVEPAQGKTFHTEALNLDAIRELPGVTAMSAMVEENAWLTNKQNEDIVQLRGVDDAYGALTGLDSLLYEGTYILHGETPAPPAEADDDELPPRQATQYLVMGGEIFYNLGISTYSNCPVGVHIPKRGSQMGLSMDEAFNNGWAYPAGYFYLQQEIDSRYVVADIDFVRGLMDYDSDEVTAIALRTKGNTAKVKRALSELLGDDYLVKDRLEQQPLYYKVFKSERLGIILILSLIVLIATLNLVASLSLLIIDKRRDIGILQSMGLPDDKIRQLFFTEGVMICAVGVAAGLLVGFVVCLLQQQFGIVKMGGGNFVVQAFPVAMRLGDFLLTTVLVMTLSAGAVALTVRRGLR